MSPARKLKRKSNKQRFSILMDLDLHDFLARKSFDSGISMSAYVVSLMPSNWPDQRELLIKKQEQMEQSSINQKVIKGGFNG